LFIPYANTVYRILRRYTYIWYSITHIYNAKVYSVRYWFFFHVKYRFFKDIKELRIHNSQISISNNVWTWVRLIVKYSFGPLNLNIKAFQNNSEKRNIFFKCQLNLVCEISTFPHIEISMSKICHKNHNHIIYINMQFYTIKNPEKCHIPLIHIGLVHLLYMDYVTHHVWQFNNNPVQGRITR
jgi:hypothetical protein